MKKKVAFFPCNGIGQITSTTTRETAWQIQKMRPGKILLISSPELITDDKKTLEDAKKHPLIAIDGCMKKCATEILSAKGIKAALIINLPRVCVDKKLSLAGAVRSKVGPGHRRVAKAIAEIAAKEIDKLL
ncbi:MAG: hypothetical protein NTV07_03550 [Candidatus Omnitrophica bacterium]|nr:hypothetical protein [Candidatus Omnitrophota bacterium]